MYKIDLNCDLGESFGAYKLGQDAEILNYITSANIACGFHAGDPSVMRKTVKLAMDNGVAIGAHPGLPDLAGFGRRPMKISAQEAYDMVVYQIGALAAFVKAQGGKMQHVKPHGALYNMAASNCELAEAIAEAVSDIDPNLFLFGLSGSELIKAGAKLGLRTANEIFADRTYQADGTLTPRAQDNALISDKATAVAQVMKLIKEQRVKADTVCIHGDGPQALSFAKHMLVSLRSGGIAVQSIK